MTEEVRSGGVNDLVDMCGGLSLDGGGSGSEVFDLGEGDDATVRQRWILLGSILGKKKINVRAVETTLKGVWNPIMDMRLEVVEENLFTFEFFHRKDMQRVLDDGLWYFDGHLVALTEVTDDTVLCKEVLTYMQIWVQIHGLPVPRVVPATAEKMGAALGKVIEVDRGTGDGLNSLHL